MSSGDLSWTVKHKNIQIKYNDGRKMLLKVWFSKKLLSPHMVVFLKCLNKFGKRESAREREREKSWCHLWMHAFICNFWGPDNSVQVPDKACQLLVFSPVQTEKYDS